MPKKLFKYKLLLDENMPGRVNLPSLNRKFNLKHISVDYKLTGLSDPEIYEFALKDKRPIVTYNTKELKTLKS